MSRRAETIVACVEDADEDDNPIAGTDRYASSVAPGSPKQQPNTSRARREKARRGSSSPITTSALTDSDSTVHPRRDILKKPSKDRERSVSSKKALMASGARPPVKQTKTTPSMSRKDEAAFYGVEPAVTSAGSRPRAKSRPSSFYGPSPRPPQANQRFYQSQTPVSSLPTSFQPPQWGPPPGPSSIAPPYGSPSPAPLVMQHPHPPPSDYFARPLESRFGGGPRPQSAMGYRPPPRAIEYDDFEEPVENMRSLARRPSAARKMSRNEEDRKAMPPPPRRPSSARPTALAFRPPPQTPARQPRFDDHDPDDDSLFHDISPFGAGSYEYTNPFPFRPRPSFGADQGYDPHDHLTEVAGRRRSSFYGGTSASSGSAYEDKIRQATRYQDDVVGGPKMPLTAETLRKAGRSGASSRSTRSSGSHDESEYRQSATTRTTRSTAPNDEDVTIKVRGSTTLKFGNTEMQCQDGAEINIISRGGNAEIRTGGSDQSSYIDQDDRRTRVDIPQSRIRAQSRAKSRPRSYSRPLSRYDADPKYELGHRYDAGPPDFGVYGSYGQSPFLPSNPPPYPEYPSSYSSRHGDGFFGPPL